MNALRLLAPAVVLFLLPGCEKEAAAPVCPPAPACPACTDCPKPTEPAPCPEPTKAAEAPPPAGEKPAIPGFSPAGKELYYGMASDITTYRFCKNGTVLANYETQDFKRSGIWRIAGDKLVLLMNRELGQVGVGEPFNCVAAARTVCSYRSYRKALKDTWVEESFDIPVLVAPDNGFSFTPLRGGCQL